MSHGSLTSCVAMLAQCMWFYRTKPLLPLAAQAVHNVTEFEDLDAAHNASNPPLVIPPLPDNATTMDIIQYAALCVWRKPCLPPVQEYAVHKLVYDPL